MTDAASDPVNGPLEDLIARWCDRKDLVPLATVLPAYLANNGLTDGWAGLMDALRDLSARRCLPDDEQDLVEQTLVLVEQAVFRT